MSHLLYGFRGGGFFYGSSKSYLVAEPLGQYATDQIKNKKKGLVALLVGVYGVLDGQRCGRRPHVETSAINWATAVRLLMKMLIKGPDANDQPQIQKLKPIILSPPTGIFTINGWHYMKVSQGQMM
jgi:hypothetical protein